MKRLLLVVFLMGALSACNQPVVHSVDINPQDMRFPVLGSAKGQLVVKGKMACVAISSATIWENPEKNIHPRLTGLRFGVAAPYGAGEWNWLGKGKRYPFQGDLDQGRKVNVPGLITDCFDVSHPLEEGKYWVTMEMYVTTPDGVEGTTYSHTNEYAALMK